MKVVYIERLTFMSLISILISGLSRSEIFYFDTSVPLGLLKLLKKIGIIRKLPVALTTGVTDVQGKGEESPFYRMVGDTRQVTQTIVADCFPRYEQFMCLDNTFSSDTMRFYLQKVIGERLYPVMGYIYIATRHFKQTMPEDCKMHYVFENSYYGDYIRQYLNSYGVIPHAYWAGMRSELMQLAGKVLQMAKLRFSAKKPIPVHKQKDNHDKRRELKKHEKPMLAAWYTGKTITLDKHIRSDFFWYESEAIKSDSVIIMCDRTDIPVTEADALSLTKNGIQVLALNSVSVASKTIPLWQESAQSRIMARPLLKHLAHCYAVSLLKFSSVPVSVCLSMATFVLRYAYWRDLFTRNMIKIHLRNDDFAITNAPQQEAIKHCGGVGISYQWSNLSFASTTMSSTADVFFSFGPRYEDVFRQNGSNLRYFVSCGYITDHAFSLVKHRSQKLRKQLEASGARFIICFLDENSADDRLSMIPNSRSADIYTAFLQKVLNDPTIGVIFKPGYPHSLYKRISTSEGLIEAAKATGRCVFIDKGFPVTENYPTEAAQASDLCVGLLASGTVALESYLSGVRTVFLDMEHCYSSDVYTWGKNTIVFEDCVHLFTAIEQYRHNPESTPDFGDLSRWAVGRDPFRDGRASQRMSGYMGCLLECFERGESRESALAYAASQYASAWGSEHIITWH